MNKKSLVALALLFSATLSIDAATYLGNANTGFGGPLGNGSLVLTDDGTTISGTINSGLTTGGGFGDTLVIYIDSVIGGIASTSGLTDTADANRKAISAFDGTNRATINFPISADFALALSPVPGSFGGVWSLSNSSNLPFVAGANLTPTGSSSSATYSFSFTLANIGLTAGQSFNFVATYLNGDSGFLSNESLAGITGYGGTNPGSGSSTTLGSSLTYTTVPEPSTWLLGVGGLVVFFAVRKLRRVA